MGIVGGLEVAGNDLGGIDVRLGSQFFEFEVVGEGVGYCIAVLAQEVGASGGAGERGELADLKMANIPLLL
ncbi:hypothetical protein [Streptomyces glebosus]|uniref:hypothetical protein n=1 Tax=Streptomyces glebosus TaxID=249580 RepID=UPI00167CE70E|nr:hypothetical protein [Streptomyces glebosus]